MASNLIVMASNLRAMASNPHSDGLQPKSGGHQPDSNGLQPNMASNTIAMGDALKPESDGLQPIDRNGSNPRAMASNLGAMISILLAISSNLIVMASILPATVLVWNPGGLSRCKLDDFLLWAECQTAGIYILPQTRWSFESFWESGKWLFLHSGPGHGKGAGILIIVSKQLCDSSQLSHRTIIPGRLVHLRLHLAPRYLDILACYQRVGHGRYERQDDSSESATYSFEFSRPAAWVDSGWRFQLLFDCGLSNHWYQCVYPWWRSHPWHSA